MTAFVVDTNVAIVANGRGTHADLQCRLSCAQRLRAVVNEDVIAIDDAGRLLKEYRNHLSYSGQPGVGDVFFKHLVDHQYDRGRIQRVAVTTSADTRKDFEELPENSLDPSDRKFLAVAVVAKAAILNATDSDWSEQQPLLDHLRIQVWQLCPQHSSKTARR